MSDKPKSPYTDPLLNHEYDGIREFDNPMPGWWKAIFWTTFYFALGYIFYYHISGNGESIAKAYETDIAAAREREAKALMGEKITEDGLKGLMNNASLMADAKTLFLTKCAQCHGNQAEGKIGPNLTDAYWLHGDATLMGIMKIITEGVPAKGMPPWGRQLRPVEISKLAAYIGSLRNTNVPGPKGPEGTEIHLGEAGKPSAPGAASGSAAAASAETAQPTATTSASADSSANPAASSTAQAPEAASATSPPPKPSSAPAASTHNE